MPGHFVADQEIERARDLARRITQPILALIHRHTTVSIERTVLRLLGLSGAVMGIMINTLHNDSSAITGNTIIGPGIFGIYVASPSTPNTGGHTITGNTITNYSRNVDWDPSKHPGTFVQ